MIRRFDRNSLQIFVILGFLLNISQSLRFDLQSGHTKCISEDIKSNSMTVGKYHVVNPNEGYPMPDTHKVTVRVIFSIILGVKWCDFREMNPNFDLIGSVGDIGVWE